MPALVPLPQPSLEPSLGQLLHAGFSSQFAPRNDHLCYTSLMASLGADRTMLRVCRDLILESETFLKLLCPSGMWLKILVLLRRLPWRHCRWGPQPGSWSSIHQKVQSNPNKPEHWQTHPDEQQALGIPLPGCLYRALWRDVGALGCSCFSRAEPKH